MGARLDSMDIRILAALQRDADLGAVGVSEGVGLSPSQCSRRIQRLRQDGTIRTTVAVVEKAHVNLGIVAIVLVRLAGHGAQDERAFREWVARTPEILSCHYVAGDLDFILQVATRDLASYDAFINGSLLATGRIAACRSNIVLKTLKETTELPLHFSETSDR